MSALNLNFFAFLGLYLFVILKGIFCLEQTCWGNRTFVQKEMFLASVCYVSFTLLNSVSIQHFCLLVFLMAQFPFLFAFIMKFSPRPCAGKQSMTE